MSGRLVILRHKSWHVWNQDNQEKVLRDERLAKESEEAKSHLEKRRAQEKNLELLTGESKKSNDREIVSRSFQDETSNAGKREAKQKEDVPEKLGQLMMNKPWYLRPESSTVKSSDHSHEDDPMRNFVRESSETSSTMPKKGISSFSTIDLNELREKRLKREKHERKRAIDLLANHEIYGSNGLKRKKEH